MKTLVCSVGLIASGVAPVAADDHAPDFHRREADSPSSVRVIDREALLAAGVTSVGDALQKLATQGTALNARSTGSDGTIRVNLRSLIERIEVLEDGASASYGSGAIAGVVNLITRTDVIGTEVNVFTSTSNPGDGISYDLSFVTGQSSDRGNIMLSGGYQYQTTTRA